MQTRVYLEAGRCGLGCAKMVVESEYKENTMKDMKENIVIISKAEHIKWGECELNNPTLAPNMVH